MSGYEISIHSEISQMLKVVEKVAPNLLSRSVNGSLGRCSFLVVKVTIGKSATKD